MICEYFINVGDYVVWLYIKLQILLFVVVVVRTSEMVQVLFVDSVSGL